MKIHVVAVLFLSLLQCVVSDDAKKITVITVGFVVDFYDTGYQGLWKRVPIMLANVTKKFKGSNFQFQLSGIVASLISDGRSSVLNGYDAIKRAKSSLDGTSNFRNATAVIVLTRKLIRSSRGDDEWTPDQVSTFGGECKQKPISIVTWDGIMDISGVVATAIATSLGASTENRDTSECFYISSLLSQCGYSSMESYMTRCNIPRIIINETETC